MKDRSTSDKALPCHLVGCRLLNVSPQAQPKFFTMALTFQLLFTALIAPTNAFLQIHNEFFRTPPHAICSTGIRHVYAPSKFWMSDTGDSHLSKSVGALLTNDVQTAIAFLNLAKKKFHEEGLLDQREDLLSEVDKRIQRELQKSNTRPDARSEIRRVISLKNEADKLLAHAATAVGNRDLVKARQILEDATQILDSAGYDARRDREAIIGNLYSSILIEQERNEARARQMAKRAKEEEFHRQALEHLQAEKAEANGSPSNDAAIESMEGDLIILVDNGSSVPRTTLNLRKIANRLAARLGIKVWSEVDCGNYSSSCRLGKSRGFSQIC